MLERRQFRILYRDFLARLVDMEVLSAGGSIQNLLVQFVAMLAAFNFVAAVVIVPRYGTSRMPYETLMMSAWSDEEFLISTSMAIAGLFMVLAWNALFPSRKDSLVLGALPVKVRTIFEAKTAAIATALITSVVASNVFTGVAFPFVTIAPHGGLLDVLRSIGAYWITMAAGGLFVFSALLAIQGAAAQLLPYSMFLRGSSLLQLTAFFAILSVYFLTPPIANLRGLTNPANHDLLKWIPAFWFLGLFQELSGSSHPVFGPLAARALWALGVAFAIAALGYLGAYARSMRRIIEQPDVVPTNRSRPSSRLYSWLARRLLAKPLERAVVLFVARTLARSREHRLVVAGYGGIALAIAMAYAKRVLYGNAAGRWSQVNESLLVGSFVLLFFGIIGARAAFALPSALPANWVFRITAVHRPASYFVAVRKALLGVTAVPIWLACAAIYFSVWPSAAVWEHMAVLILFGIVLLEMSLHHFHKIPFTCSYLPGKANLRLKLGVWAIPFLFLCDRGVAVEAWALERFARWAVLCAILLVVAIWAKHRTSEFDQAPGNRVEFEDLPAAEVHALDLHTEHAWTPDEAYIDGEAAS